MNPGHKIMEGRKSAIRYCNLRYFFTGIILLLFNTLLQSWPTQLRTTSPKDEWHVKATFLITFAAIAEWPEDSLAHKPKIPFIIGVVGDKTILPYLNKVIEKKKEKDFNINGKPIKAVALSNNELAPHCQMLFFSSASDERFNEILKIIDNLPVLTVANSKHFQEKKVMINLFIERKEKAFLRFNVSRAAAKKSGISLTSRIVRSAVHVFD